MTGAEGELPGAVLFCCNHNTIRSPMAAAILRRLGGRSVYVASAGVRTGEPDPFAIAAMEEIGLDLENHKPIAIAELEDMSFDVIITLTPEAHHQALELTRTMAADVEYWPTYDPSITTGNREQVMDAYRGLRDGLVRRIRKRFCLEQATALSGIY